MTLATKKLFLAELRRQWSLIALLAPLLFLVIGTLTIFFPHRWATKFDVAQKVQQAFTSLLPIICATFCVGLVSNDVKEGWLRTLLVRAIKREKYLLIKMLAAFTSVWVSLLFAVGLPLVVGILITEKPIVFDFGDVMVIFLFFIGISFTFISILTFLSCWLPGILNVAVLFVWWFFSVAARNYVSLKLWDKPWAVQLQEFLFPSGFFNALEAARSQGYVPYGEIFWGLAGLLFFLSLAFWSITRIQVDKGSE